jgi:hypothetical protein
MSGEIRLRADSLSMRVTMLGLCAGIAACTPAVAAPSEQVRNEKRPVRADIGVAVGQHTGPLSNRYQTALTDGRLVISANLEYLALLSRGGPIEPIHFWHEPFEWDFPIVQVNVINDSDRPVTVTEAVFGIERSALDPTPIPIVIPDATRHNALHVAVLNDGWGELADARIEFNLFPIGQGKADPKRPDSPFRHVLKAGSIVERTNLDISEAIIKEGVDLSALRGRRRDDYSPDDKAFGRFKGGGADLVGALKYQAGTPDGRREPRSVAFRTQVWFYNEFRVGAPPPPQYGFEAWFEVDRAGYEVRVPITRTIPAHGREQFGIRIGAAKSSRHDFTLRLRRRMGGELVTSPPTRLGIFVSRSGAEYIQGR